MRAVGLSGVCEPDESSDERCWRTAYIARLPTREEDPIVKQYGLIQITEII